MASLRVSQPHHTSRRPWSLNMEAEKWIVSSRPDVLHEKNFLLQCARPRHLLSAEEVHACGLARGALVVCGCARAVRYAGVR